MLLAWQSRDIQLQRGGQRIHEAPQDIDKRIQMQEQGSTLRVANQTRGNCLHALRPSKRPQIQNLRIFSQTPSHTPRNIAQQQYRQKARESLRGVTLFHSCLSSKRRQIPPPIG
jgi:hypothetical protein